MRHVSVWLGRAWQLISTYTKGNVTHTYLTQHQTWLTSEGDSWFLRNQHTMGRISFDPVLTLLHDYSLTPHRILEVGCSNAWRLDAIRRFYGCECVGIDPSVLALEHGREAYPEIELHRGTADNLPFADGEFDLVIIYYVFYAMDRAMLLRSVAEIDRVVADDGYVIIGDFAPDAPCSVAYKHVVGMRTYKQDYAEILLASRLYSEVATVTYSHDTHERSANVGSRERGMCALLRKGDYYCVAS